MSDKPYIQSGRDTIRAGGDVTQIGGTLVGGDKITHNYLLVLATVLHKVARPGCCSNGSRGMSDEPYIQSGRDTIRAGGDVTQIGGDHVGGDKITHNYYAAPAPENERERRNRTVMLHKVHDFWITGVLENSLHRAALINLGMAYQPDAVVYPWEMVIERPDTTPHTLPTGTPIISVFDDLRGELLILGAPGSGKTIMLLELTRTLIVRAQQDETHPIPVIFNLSSWAEQHLSLIDWLVTELNARYDVPRKVGQAWIVQDQVLPLLDGLDEVHQDARDACVEAINTYRQEYGMTGMVVCSRVADYSALTAKLKLRSAVVLQPLSNAQIDAYLQQIGDPLVTVRTLLREDPEMHELAETPLMLSIIVMMYQGMPSASLTCRQTVKERQRHLFATYTERMLQRRSIHTPFACDHTLRWLTWLASAMARQGQSIFLIEGLQPQILPINRLRQHYTLIDRLGGVGVGLMVGFIVILINIIQAALQVGWLDGTEHGVRLGLTGGVTAALIGGLCGGEFRSPSISSKFAGHLFLQIVCYGSLIGIIVGVFYQVCFDFPNALPTGFVGGILGAFGSALAGTTGLRPRNIVLVETLGWGWQKASLFTLGGIVVGFVIGSMMGLSYDKAISGGVGEKLLKLSGGWIGFGAIAALAGGIVGMLGGGMADEIGLKSRPNEGIWRSVRIAAQTGATGGLTISLCVWLIIRLADPGYAVTLGFGAGLIGGFIVSMAYGGYAVLSHLVLRLILWYHGAAPWNYARFLDYAAERILLRKVGGGYIFVHRMLLEYFANLELEQRKLDSNRGK